MRRLAVGAGLLVALAAGCNGDQGPRGGELAVRLATPRTTDRAVQLTVIGPQTGVAVPPGSSYQVFYVLSADGDTSRIVVVAPAGMGVVAGNIALIAVPDLGKAGSYVARVVDVATAGYEVDDTAGVALSLTRP